MAHLSVGVTKERARNLHEGGTAVTVDLIIAAGNYLHETLITFAKQRLRRKVIL